MSRPRAVEKFSTADVCKWRRKRYACSMCRYSSNRYFNITRHERRIHTIPKRQPHCCDIKFETKAEYYIHCEDVHPGMRVNLISRTKYGIGAGSDATESTIADADTSKTDVQDYPQTRYMLRSRLRPHSDTKLSQNSLDSIDDLGGTTKITADSSEYVDDNCSSANWTSSSSESSDVEKNPDLDYTCSDDEKNPDLDYACSDDEKNPDLDYACSDDEKNPDLDYACSDDQKSDEKSTDVDSYSDDHDSSCDNENLENESQITSDEAPTVAFEQRDQSENINREQPSVERNEENINREQPSVDRSEENIPPSENDSMPTKSTVSVFEDRTCVIYSTSDKSTIGVDSETPITSAPSNLPLKKRILQNLAIQNGENIENSRKPIIGDRLYQAPINVERKIEKVSKKCRQPKEKRRRLRKKMTSSTSISVHDAENIPPKVSFTQSNKESVVVEFRKDERSSWQQLTLVHREYLTEIIF